MDFALDIDLDSDSSTLSLDEPDLFANLEIIDGDDPCGPWTLASRGTKLCKRCHKTRSKSYFMNPKPSAEV